MADGVQCDVRLTAKPLTQNELRLIEIFRSGVETLAGTQLGLGRLERHDRDDHWTMATRWPIDRRWWLELAVRPTLPQVRVAVVTDDPMRSRDAEALISESSLTAGEFVGLAFRDAGLAWAEPPVEHCREREDRFCFATPLDLESLNELVGEAIRDKVMRMLDGYCRCLTGRIL